jgi:ABC-2 type transport system ATP-binding protein
VLTTHYLDEADTFAERVIVVDHGQVIADDTADALKAELAGDLVALRVPAEHAADLAAIAERAPGTRSVRVADDFGVRTVEIRTADGPGATPGLLRAADAAGLEVSRVDVARPTLDDVFLGLTGRSLRETGVDAAGPDEPSDTPTSASAPSKKEVLA